MSHPPRDPNPNRRVIAATCRLHGTPGYCNLVISKLDGRIELDAHAVGFCVLVLNEAAATELRDALIGWLG